MKIKSLKLSEEATFEIELNGTLCHVFLEPNGVVRFCENDFRRIKFNNVADITKTLDIVEKRVIKAIKQQYLKREKDEN